MNYYNEFDPQAAAWLRALIADGQIPDGYVDERSIEDVTPNDLRGYTQCHFFAGIGGWPLALQFAGWPADRPIWTGSCPCQPFSAAGKNNGFADERHLWPAFHWLIEQCRPAVVVGEQVASAAVGPWIDLVLTDLEALGYASGAYAGPAAGVGAPHIRDRSYWVGYTGRPGLQERQRDSRVSGGPTEPGTREATERTGVHVVRMADASSERRFGRKGVQAGRIDDRANARREQGHDGPIGHDEAGDARTAGAGPTNGHWRVADWLRCRDDRWRPVESGTFPLAHGVPARVGRLRGYGNAIVPQQAAQFIQALMEYQACLVS